MRKDSKYVGKKLKYVQFREERGTRKYKNVTKVKKKL